MFKFKSIFQELYNHFYDPNRIGYNYEKGIFPFRKNYSKAFYYYSIAAKKGNALGYNNLGWLYVNGFGVRKNKEKAKDLYIKAMEQELPIAFVNLGNIYESEGMQEKFDKKLQIAFELYEIGALLGDEKATFNYYNCILNGRGTKKNPKKALPYFLKVAMKIPSAAYNVGLIYSNSKGKLKNYKEAIKYYKLAAKRGEAWAFTNLGNLFYDGKGTTKNIKKAIYYYKKAITLGDTLSYVNLGNTYKDLKKYEKSIQYYEKGAELGEEHCIKKMKKIAQNKSKGKISVLVSHKKWKNEFFKKIYKKIDKAFEEQENSKSKNSKEKDK